MIAEKYNLREHGDVHQFLEISKKHLRYIQKSRSKEIRVPGVKVQHALVASIFSSAAIEAALNLFIVIPVLYIEEGSTRKFFGALAQRYQRLNVRAKLSFAKSFFPANRATKTLFDNVNKFFDYRNTIIHASSDYAEPRGLPDSDTLPEVMNLNDLVPRPQLLSTGKGSDDVAQAFNNYRLACTFINKLSRFQIQANIKKVE